MSKLIPFFAFIRREGPRSSLFTGMTSTVVWLSDWLPKASGHPEFAPLLTCVYMILILVAFAHIARRFLFHKLDLQKIAVIAIEEKNLPAAIVFLSIILVFIALIFSLTSMLR